MEVAFVRVPGRVQSEAVVRHEDGRVLVVPSPGAFREVPPHDLGQLVVEQALGWQTGFWGYVARGVLFPGMSQTEGRRRFHADERSRAAIRDAKELLAEVESLAGVIALLARGELDRDPDRVAHELANAWWPPRSSAAGLPIADVRRACDAFRGAERDWRALPPGGCLRFRWAWRRNPCAPENPLDVRAVGRRARS